MNDRLNIIDFGRQTIQSGDLDPLYIALNKVDWQDGQQARWLLAYWCLYHAGAASYLSQQSDEHFWRELKIAARNEPGYSPVGDLWPRGKERRHWRGEASVNSAQHLYGRFQTPIHVLGYLQGGVDENGRTILNEDPGTDPVPVMKRAQSLTGFGPWISFKVADMLDALNLRDLDFSSAAVFMFDQPQEAAMEVWRAQMKVPDNVKPKDPAKARDGVVAWLLEQFKDLPCPHKPERGIRLQEVETVLCKWKSHMNGHYPLKNDIHEISVGLTGWVDTSPVAKQLQQTIEAMK